MTQNEIKVRENRLRRVAARRGLKLTKSYRRDPHALDYGLFALVDLRTDEHLNGGPFSHNWTLNIVEDYLGGVRLQVPPDRTNLKGELSTEP
jgi:hypothetical protein